jgi:amidase
MAEPHDLGAVEQAAAIRRGELSPVELVDRCLDRIACPDGGLGAFVTVTDAAARDRAREAERAVPRVRRRVGRVPGHDTLTTGER